MKKIIAVSCLVLVSVALISFSVARNRFNEMMLKALDISDREAKSSIEQSFMGNYFSYSDNQAIRTYPAGKRAAMVKQLGDYMKAYLKTPAFAKEYETRRNSQAPEGWDKVVDQEVYYMKRRAIDEIDRLKSTISSAPANMKAMYQRQLKEAEDQLAVMRDPKNPGYKDVLAEAEVSAGKKENKESFMAAYEEKKKEFDERFPANVNELIRARLQGFLTLTAGMDFDAKLVKGGLGMKFEDPELESKPRMWKTCFRAGRETITAGRAYAEAWLKTLPPAGK